ncbi:MAG: NAD(P)-dependent oxidoreductase [Gemmatimonadota bacterium]
MKILVFGPTGGTGRAIVDQALAAGHDVTAFARDPSRMDIFRDKLNILWGDVLDDDAVADAVPGHDAVLSALGVTGGGPANVCSEGTHRILAAMEASGVRRFVCESAYGAGETRGRGPYARFLRVWIPRQMKDKDRMEEFVRLSSAEWVIVRPPILTNGPRTGEYRVDDGLRLGWVPRISRADVADFMLRVAEGHARLRDAPTIAY